MTDFHCYFDNLEIFNDNNSGGSCGYSKTVATKKFMYDYFCDPNLSQSPSDILFFVITVTSFLNIQSSRTIFKKSSRTFKFKSRKILHNF